MLVAALGGAAIGLERQWSGHASGPGARFGGIRTFTMVGGAAGLAGWLATTPLLPLAVVLLASLGALIVSGYIAASRRDVDATTETAALVLLGAGAASGSGFIMVGSAIVAITVLLLIEKSRLHSLVAHVDDEALRASVRFAVMALVVLPLLPRGPYGPFGAVRPQELWAFVLFFSGLSFLGWLARRVVGERRGPTITGLLGGLISSTTVTLTAARASRNNPDVQLPLALGVIGACTVMLARVAAASAVLNRPLAAALLPYIALPFAIGSAVLAATWRAGGRGEHAGVSDAHESPLQLRAALQMTLLFQVVIILVSWVRTWWGTGALMMTSALVGLTDLDALTLSLARSTGAEMAAAGAAALTMGILANTVLKLALAVGIGQGTFRWVTALVLGAMSVATGLALWLRVRG
jgi:uncharacterized membrane protein (DUF4010 family)